MSWNKFEKEGENDYYLCSEFMTLKMRMKTKNFNLFTDEEEVEKLSFKVIYKIRVVEIFRKFFSIHQKKEIKYYLFSLNNSFFVISFLKYFI